MPIHFTSGGTNQFDCGQGDNTAIVKESTGSHLIEVDNSNSKGRSWLEIGFIILALKMGLMCTHAVHYFCLTKKLVKKKLTKAVEIEMKNVNPPVVIPVPGVLKIPALP